MSVFSHCFWIVHCWCLPACLPFSGIPTFCSTHIYVTYVVAFEKNQMRKQLKKAELPQYQKWNCKVLLSNMQKNKTISSQTNIISDMKIIILLLHQAQLYMHMAHWEQKRDESHKTFYILSRFFFFNVSYIEKACPFAEDIIVGSHKNNGIHFNSNAKMKHKNNIFVIIGWWNFNSIISCHLFSYHFPCLHTNNIIGIKLEFLL